MVLLKSPSLILVSLLHLAAPSLLMAQGADESKNDESTKPEPAEPASVPADSAEPSRATVSDKLDPEAKDSTDTIHTFKGNIALSHSIGAKSDSDPSTAIDLSGTYRQTKELTWLAIQRFSKLYVVDPHEDEFIAADTLLRGSYRLFKDEDRGTIFSLSGELRAPISTFSREQGLKTIASVLATVTRDIGPFSFLLRPYYRFHANSYKTLKHDDSGQTVVRARKGIRFDVSLKLPYSLSLVSSNEWIDREYEQPPHGSHPSDHDYVFDNSIGYQFDAKTALSLGYTQTNRAEQLGNVDVYLFDQDVTEYYLSLSRDF